MAVVTWTCYEDNWLAEVDGANRGKGNGDRLQVGYAVTTGGAIWKNRSTMSFYRTAANAIPSNATITSVVWKAKVRGTNGCFSQGSAPKFWIERFADVHGVIDENNASAAGVECAVAQGSDSDQRWPGPEGGALITTNRVKYEGDPASGEVISVTITAMFNAWWAAGGRSDSSHFAVRLIAADATTGYDETTSARKIAFFSSESYPATLVITYTTVVAPSAPSAALSPAGGVRVAVTGTRSFTGDFSHPTVPGPPTSIRIQVSLASDMDDPIHDQDSGSTITYPAPGNIWAVTRSYSETRGALHYWRCMVTASNGAQSGWSAIQNYRANSLPTVTKTRPAP